MNLQTIFGRYISRDSVVHRMDPRAKLLLSVLFMVVVFAAQSYVALAVAAVFTFGMFFFAKISIKQAFVSIAPLAILVVFTGLLNIFFVQGGQIYFQFGIICISEQGLNQCLFIVIRLTLLLLGMSLLTLSTTTLNITDGFEELLKPFKRFGVPAHELATMMGIALRFLPQFATELQTIYRAQVSRGANFKTNARGTFSMIAETLSLGMDARCYHGGTNRTSLHELRFQKCDLGGLLYLICGLACVILVNIVMGYFGL